MRNKLFFASLAAAVALAGCATATPLSTAPAAQQAAASAEDQNQVINAPNLTNTKGKPLAMYTTLSTWNKKGKVTTTWKPASHLEDDSCGDSVKIVMNHLETVFNSVFSFATETGPDISGDKVLRTSKVDNNPLDDVPAGASGGGPVPGALGVLPNGSFGNATPPDLLAVEINGSAKQTTAYQQFGGPGFSNNIYGGAGASFGALSAPTVGAPAAPGLFGPTSAMLGQIPYQPGPNNPLNGNPLANVPPPQQWPGVAGQPINGLAGVNATGVFHTTDNNHYCKTLFVKSIIVNPSTQTPAPGSVLNGISGGRSMVSTLAGFDENGDQWVMTVQDASGNNGIGGGLVHGSLVNFAGARQLDASDNSGFTGIETPYNWTIVVPLDAHNLVEAEIGRLCTSPSFTYGGYNHL